ncbi:MAG: hypothetical protein LBS84_07410 [Clostridiales bacterium]|jgi:hypothetical protein|nr:hypothetical protein [Clostridiales bacterium]
MLAVVYLLLSIFLGYIFINIFTPYVFRPKSLYMHFTRSTRLFPRLFVVFPASFTVGAILSGWLLYIPSYLLRDTERPLFYGSIAAFSVMIFITVPYLIFKRSFIRDLRLLCTDFFETIKENIILAVFFSFALAFAIWLMTLTFYIKDGNIHMGVSVFSDFAVHTAIIRSFSEGSNFPTQFPHFPDGTIRYHFMFQFFTGALEYMGMRIDIALNLMSVTALLNATLLLYVVAVIVTQNRSAGILTVVLFLFRSSFAAPRFIMENWPFGSTEEFITLITGKNSFITPFSNDSSFLGYTTNEETWGLYNMNVYANQRHFALGISMTLFGLLAMIPLMKKMYYIYEYRSLTIKERAKEFFFTASAWAPQSYWRAAALGVLFGASAFFHGSAVIALLSMLAVMGLFSKHRLEYLIIAAITYALATLQTNFFAPGVELARPRLVFGFISPDKSPMGLVAFIVMLTGIALFLALLGLFTHFRRFKVFFLMFLTPLIITFTISLTPDVTVNHKFLMISMALLNIFAAYAVCVIMDSVPGKAIGVILVAFMVSTGVIDALTVQSRNGGGRSIAIARTSPYQEWLLNETEPGSIFLTAWNGVNELFFTGRYEFYGWPYYAWSGGYDTGGRQEVYRAMLRPGDAENFSRLAKENKISYVVIEPELFDVNDMGFHFADPDLLNILQSKFPVVYSEPERQLYVIKTDYNP